ncbi:hypothetical protein O1611_g10480 [Lasiodiplodia mahajangana]|uniref:Uncharacterized protein n=1 Tax=Lasiodiplodia mahajangana TaxID=1108764 RepID=A0ACC2IY12_9PEZI|nr:hypothetical protein O1611_g10480 [Lasiodiplodia mahajangana]
MASQENHPVLQLTRIPVELVIKIASYLPNRDIKNLRLTCIFLRNTVTLRLSRVFLSANPRNVEVFRAVADHDLYREAVTELIWDDALMGPDIQDASYNYDDDDVAGLDILTSQGVPSWFSSACEENIDGLRRRKGRDRDTPQHELRSQQLESQLPLRESWSYYQNLAQQEERVIASESDADALR